MSERRVDPQDGVAYTLKESTAFYAGQYVKSDIRAYWDTCRAAKSVDAKNVASSVTGAAGAAFKNGKKFKKAQSNEQLWKEVGSQDFLQFSFGGVEYGKELERNVAKAKNLSAIKCSVKDLTLNGGATKDNPAVRVMYMEHDWAFFGGSLGCAEGEKLTRGFEYALANNLPVVIRCASGGARMQEGTSSLMQMAKISCAVQALNEARLPFLTLLADPCYGGVSASYAMQADVRIGAAKGRLGFSGPAVILNTQFGANQAAFDRACPDAFQSNEFGMQHGIVDIVVKSEEMDEAAYKVISVLQSKAKGNKLPKMTTVPQESDAADFRVSRNLDRYDADDIVAQICSSYMELGGDGMDQMDLTNVFAVDWAG